MLIPKEAKELYSFLQVAEKMMKSAAGEEVMFVEGGKIFFGTWSISGSIEIKKDGKNQYTELKDGFYSISRTPKQHYKLDKINAQNMNENTKIQNDSMQKRVHEMLRAGRYMCKIAEGEAYVLAKLCNETEKFVRDSYLSAMRGMKDFEVEENQHCIKIIHEEYLEKEALQVVEELSFYCEKTRADDFNQDKMEV